MHLHGGLAHVTNPLAKKGRAHVAPILASLHDALHVQALLRDMQIAVATAECCKVSCRMGLQHLCIHSSMVSVKCILTSKRPCHMAILDASCAQSSLSWLVQCFHPTCTAPPPTHAGVVVKDVGARQPVPPQLILSVGPLNMALSGEDMCVFNCYSTYLLIWRCRVRKANSSCG